jgi:hypothetical protein
MDFNQLLHRHQVALIDAAHAPTDRERRVHAQLARGHADQIRETRLALGARPAVQGAVT